MLHASATSHQTTDAAPRINRSNPRDLHRFHFNRFVNDRSNFAPRDGPLTVEVEETEGSGISLSESELLGIEISAWPSQVTVLQNLAFSYLLDPFSRGSIESDCDPSDSPRERTFSIKLLYS
jgi:hypothetical protein